MQVGLAHLVHIWVGSGRTWVKFKSKVEFLGLTALKHNLPETLPCATKLGEWRASLGGPLWLLEKPWHWELQQPPAMCREHTITNRTDAAVLDHKCTWCDADHRHILQTCMNGMLMTQMVILWTYNSGCCKCLDVAGVPSHVWFDENARFICMIGSFSERTQHDWKPPVLNTVEFAFLIIYTK